MSRKPDLTPIVFDEERFAEVPVTLGGQEFVIREASGGVAAEYRNATMKGFVLDPQTGKPVKLEGLADVEPLLVSRCLRRVTIDPDTEKRILTAVSEHEVRQMKAPFIKAVFDRIKQISELTDEPETREELEKQLADIQKKIAELDAEESSPGNEQ